MSAVAKLSSQIGFVIFAAVCLSSASAWPAAAPADDTGPTATYLKVTNVRPGSVLWVRVGPSTRAERIGFFRHDDRHIRSFGCKTFRVTWCEVQYRGTRGWASKLYLEEDAAARAATRGAPALRVAWGAKKPPGFNGQRLRGA